MSKEIFLCKHCEHDIFTDEGKIVFANIYFRGLKCVRCGNISLLQEKVGVSPKFRVNLDTNSDKNELISTKFD